MAEDMTAAETDVYARLLRQLRVAAVGNKRRTNLFLARERLDEVGFSVPESMREFAAVVGWPEKAVTAPARRIRPGRFTVPGDRGVEDELNTLMEAETVRLVERMAIDKSVLHGPAFVFVTRGDTAAGEDDVIVSARDATEASALVDRRTLRTTAALELVDPTTEVLYLPGQTLVLDLTGGRRVVADRVRGIPGIVPCVPYVWGRSLDRLFGRSRLTRPVMDLSGMAVRTLLRAEVTAEHFSRPQRVLEGARDEAFRDAKGNPIPSFKLETGSIWGIPDFYDEETGEWQRANLKQLSGASQQPHMEHLRTITMMMASESAIPLHQLGVVTENPPSAEAIRATESELVGVVQSELPNYAQARRQVARLAMFTRHGYGTALSRAMEGTRAAFLNPGTVTPAAAADLAQKFIAQYPELKDEPVVLEMWGFDESQLERLTSAVQRNRGSSMLERVLQRRGGQTGDQTAAQGEDTPADGDGEDATTNDRG